MELWKVTTTEKQSLGDVSVTNYYLVDKPSQLSEWIEQEIPPLNQREARQLASNSRNKVRIFDLREGA